MMYVFVQFMYLTECMLVCTFFIVVFLYYSVEIECPISV